MAGIDSTWGSTHLKRNEIFSAQIKEMFEQPLMAQQFVNWIGEIPADSQATELKINSFGDLQMDTWAESVSLPERRMDTGQFLFRISQYPGLKVSFTDHFFETSFMANEALSRTPMKMQRALGEYTETEIMKLANDQTNNDANTINAAMHRIVGSGDGTSLPTNALSIEDFAYAKYSLRKAGAPMTGLVAVVGPETEYLLNKTANIVDISNNPRWEGIVETGLGDTTGMRFIRNIYGFDVYVSDFLAKTDGDEAALTTADGTAVSSTDGYMANMFFSLDGDAQPFIGAWGRSPRLVSWRDDDIETEYHQLTASFGLGLYRPESLVTVLSSTDV